VKLPDIPVYYINLPERSDRRALAEALWAEQLGMASLTRIDGVPATPAYAGCTRAHISAVDAILTRSARERFVILAEDDVVLLDGSDPDRLRTLLESALATFPDLDVLFLTASLHRFRKTPLEGVVRLKRNGALAMPALILRTGYARRLRGIYVQALDRGVPHDRLTLKVQGRDQWYALDPPWMRQASGFSDIEKKYVDYGDENR
jgi:NAD(P)-dependent dehydrogenase (short-subunit alcohol dehydrogenase family)